MFILIFIYVLFPAIGNIRVNNLINILSDNHVTMGVVIKSGCGFMRVPLVTPLFKILRKGLKSCSICVFARTMDNWWLMLRRMTY